MENGKGRHALSSIRNGRKVSRLPERFLPRGQPATGLESRRGGYADRWSAFKRRTAGSTDGNVLDGPDSAAPGDQAHRERGGGSRGVNERERTFRSGRASQPIADKYGFQVVGGGAGNTVPPMTHNVLRPW